MAVTKFQEICCNKTCAHNLLSRLLDWFHHVSILSLYISCIYSISILCEMLYTFNFSKEMHLILIVSSYIAFF